MSNHSVTTEHISGIKSCHQGPSHQAPNGKLNSFNEINLMSGPSSLPTVEVMGVCHGGERASYTSSIFHQTGHLLKHLVISVLFNLSNPVPPHQLQGNRGRAPWERRRGMVPALLACSSLGLPGLARADRGELL